LDDNLVWNVLFISYPGAELKLLLFTKFEIL